MRATATLLCILWRGRRSGRLGSRDSSRTRASATIIFTGFVAFGGNTRDVFAPRFYLVAICARLSIQMPAGLFFPEETSAIKVRLPSLRRLK
jgi:hypothetical protein